MKDATDHGDKNTHTQLWNYPTTTCTFLSSIAMRPVEKPFVEATTTPSSYGRGTVSICRRHGSILLVAMGRPQVKNALNDDVYEDLIEVLDRAKIDPSISAVVWTGVGSYFSAGADINDGHFETHPNAVPERIVNKPGGRFMLAIVSFPKVLCAAVQGPIVGIAATALMQCDLVYFSDKAFFWAPFSRLALGM
jgi:enoyl-CoA hydratase/carnithine racemase